MPTNLKNPPVSKIETPTLAAWLCLLIPIAQIAISPLAFAKSEIVSRAKYQSEAYKIYAELYYDKDKKQADLWIDYEQGKKPEDRIAFKATSLTSKMKEAGWKLQPTPVAHVEGETIQIFDGYDAMTGEYNGNRGLSLIFRLPVYQLAEVTLQEFLTAFPKSFLYDAEGSPRYIKALLCRITEYRVYPVAAFDVELDLASSN